MFYVRIKLCRRRFVKVNIHLLSFIIVFLSSCLYIAYYVTCVARNAQTLLTNLVEFIQLCTNIQQYIFVYAVKTQLPLMIR